MEIRSNVSTLERRRLCQPSGPDGEGQAKGQAGTRAANLPSEAMGVPVEGPKAVLDGC